MLSKDATVPPIAVILPGYLRHRLVGSLYTLGEGNDADFMVLVTEKTYDAAKDTLIEAGWTEDSDYANDTFRSLRNCGDNLILTYEVERYEATLRSAEVCRFLKIKDRDTRIALHRMIRDGWTCEQIEDSDDLF